MAWITRRRFLSFQRNKLSTGVVETYQKMPEIWHIRTGLKEGDIRAKRQKQYHETFLKNIKLTEVDRRPGSWGLW